MTEQAATKTDLKELCEDLKSFTAEMRSFVSEMKVCKTEDRKDIEYIKDIIGKFEISQDNMWRTVNKMNVKIAVAYSIPVVMFGVFEAIQWLKKFNP